MRLIDADALIGKAIEEKRFVFQLYDALRDEYVIRTVYGDLFDFIKSAPTIEAELVRHGEWEKKKHKIFGNSYDYICSVCGCDYALAEYDYCPNCGAKMDGGEKE